jgi:hypothetical protein
MIAPKSFEAIKRDPAQWPSLREKQSKSILCGDDDGADDGDDDGLEHAPERPSQLEQQMRLQRAIRYEAS